VWLTPAPWTASAFQMLMLFCRARSPTKAVPDLNQKYIITKGDHFKEKRPHTVHPPSQCLFDGTQIHMAPCVHWLPNQERAKTAANAPRRLSAAPGHLLGDLQTHCTAWQISARTLPNTPRSGAPKQGTLLLLVHAKQWSRFPTNVKL